MSLFTRLFSRKNQLKEATVTLIGPPRSGKTTFVRYLETGQPVLDPIHTTLGIDIRRQAVRVGNWKISAIDTGGQEIYQQAFWELAVHQADAVIFVLDATIRKEENEKLYELTKEQFSYALEIVPEDVPLLILLNKQDLVDKHPLTPKEAIQIFKDTAFANRTVAYLPVSAKYGTGVDEAVQWLVTKLEELR